ncbi:hypothetical protein GCM10023152_03920 [Agromyces bauzanensis]|uniref:Uncharacterized protein n=1 Tax=Agromyces bauzanensis TaxID=1308924 RepID=A0A917PD26_9MICO|nr:hypothetical protein GCM10011372_06650 [Agromyces bauzanensis]
MRPVGARRRGDRHSGQRPEQDAGVGRQLPAYLPIPRLRERIGPVQHDHDVAGRDRGTGVRGHRDAEVSRVPVEAYPPIVEESRRQDGGLVTRRRVVSDHDFNVASACAQETRDQFERVRATAGACARERTWAPEPP